MNTDRWHCWGYTDHQGTLIISALMITDIFGSFCGSVIRCVRGKQR
ncbi:unnamed protein product, partial [Staurois parvus]